MKETEFDAREALKIYNDDQVSVAIWQEPHGKREKFSHIRAAARYVASDTTEHPVVKEIIVHHEGHDIHITGAHLTQLIDEVLKHPIDQA